jgi:MFS family permease
MASLSGEYGWSKVQIASALSIATLTSSLTAPLVGRFVDRWGSRRLALSGAALLCIAFGSLGLVDQSITHYRSLWLLIAVGTSLGSPLVWALAIVTRFNVSRGLALSVASTGSNLSGVVMPLLATGLIQQLGWRAAYAALAGCMFLSTVPLAFAVFFDAGDLRARRGQTRITAPPEVTSATAGVDSLSLREAAQSRAFWLMLRSFPLAGATIVSMVVHLIPLLQEHQLAPMAAAGAASMMSIGAVVGRLGEGFFLDRVFAPRIAAVTFTPPILACLGLLLLPVNLAIALCYALMFGVAMGAEVNLVSYLCSRYFGLRSFGSIYGIQFCGFTLGCALGPPLAGMIYQLHGNYRTMLLVWVGGYFCSALLLQFCGRYTVLPTAKHSLD